MKGREQTESVKRGKKEIEDIRGQREIKSGKSALERIYLCTSYIEFILKIPSWGSNFPNKTSRFLSVDDHRIFAGITIEEKMALLFVINLRHIRTSTRSHFTSPPHTYHNKSNNNNSNY